MKKFTANKWRYSLIILIIIAAGYFFFSRGMDFGTTLTITPGYFREQVSVSGTVIAAQNVDLGFAASGRISSTNAKVGQRVSAGTILAQTENGDLIATLAQKRFALTEANADLASLMAGTRSEEIAVASASVSNAEAALADAIQNAYTVSDDVVHNKADSFFTNPRINPKLSFTTSNSVLRMTVEQDRTDIEPMLTKWGLLVSNSTNGSVVESAQQAQANLAQVTEFLADVNLAINQGLPDMTTTITTLSSYGTTIATARTSVRTAVTTLTTAIATLDSAQKNLSLKQAGSTSEDIIAQQAIVAAAQADVENAQAALVKTRVAAPFSGTVTRMDAKVGEIVSPSTSLISMQSDGIFEIETFVPEIAIARVSIGNPATTTLDAYGSSAVFPSVVVTVDPAETIKDGIPAYKTTLVFLSADSRIRSGMTANVVIETGILHNAIVIPVGAVGTKNGTQFVSVIDHGTVINRTVVTGPSPALGQIEILSGLSSGDVILLSPEL